MQLLECQVDGKWSKVVEIYVSDMLVEENTSDKDVVIAVETSNGDLSDMETDTLFKIEVVMLWTFMLIKDIMAPISTLGTERMEIIKDGFSKALEEENILSEIITQRNA